MSDRKVLILAWKMGAKRMGYFARDEFCYGKHLHSCLLSCSCDTADEAASMQGCID